MRGQIIQDTVLSQKDVGILVKAFIGRRMSLYLYM